MITIDPASSIQNPASSIRYPVSRIGYLYKQNGKYFLDAPLMKGAGRHQK